MEATTTDSILRWLDQSLARRLFLAFMVSVVAANIYAAHMYYSTIHPTRWYFYFSTRYASDGNLIRGERNDVGGEWYLQRCTHATGLKGQPAAFHRDVELCKQVGDGSAEQWERARADFGERVDELYWYYYWDLAGLHTVATAAAIGSWLSCFAIYGFVLWIIRGTGKEW